MERLKNETKKAQITNSRNGVRNVVADTADINFI